MKTSSWKKLLKNPHINLKQNSKDRRKIQPLGQFDELATASEAMEDMRDCYDSLLSAAAAATNSAYEFSESLREMGVCLLQKIALNDDEESGKVMLMLGKVQFELQKLVDGYRNHIIQTITVPSESLINELHTVEEMKHQCEEKRELYEYMRTKYREKGRNKSGKGETFSLEQLNVAKEDFDEEATLFVFRLKSLKQGQSRSLLTQAARHHSAQLSFFKKAVKSLEEIDPHVKSVTQQQHIDYQFIGLEDEESDGEDDDGSYEDDDYSSTSSFENDDDLRYDYQRDGRQLSFRAATRHPMEGNLKYTRTDSSIRERKMLSQSAPLIPQRKFDPAERIAQLQPSASRKSLSYALPKPGDKTTLVGTENPLSKTKLNPLQSENLYHSSPLEPNSYDKIRGSGTMSGPITSVLKESNNNKIPPPLTETFLMHHQKPHISTNNKKLKLQSFSGPLTSKHLSTKPILSTGNPIISTNIPKYSSGPILRSPTNQQLSSSPPKTSPTTPILNSPIISELHELPRPPSHLSSTKPSSVVGFSAPLMMRKPETSANNKASLPKIASPLPTPPRVGYFSMPLTGPGTVTKSPRSRPLETSPDSGKLEDIFSPPLTPIMLANQNPT